MRLLYSLSPSDFPLADVSQYDLDEIIVGDCDPNDIEGLYPLTSLQKGMFFHTRNEPDSLAYIDQLQCEFNSHISIDLFRQAWCHVIASHSIFRTTFLFDSLDSPLQRVHREFELPLTVLDFSTHKTPMEDF